MQIVVGSASIIKLEAAKAAFPEAVVTGLQTFVSEVPPQPVGKEQTQLGTPPPFNCDLI